MWGEIIVCCWSVLLFCIKYFQKILHSSLIAWAPKTRYFCNSAEPIHLLFVHTQSHFVKTHGEETQAHQGWILDFMIWVKSSVFSHSAFLSVQYPEWWWYLTVGSVCGHHLLLTCLCVFNVKPEFLTAKSGLSPLLPSRTIINTESS